MIRFENVSKTFVSGGRTIEAVKNVNLEIEKGKVYGIIGFSGAGKSTLSDVSIFWSGPRKAESMWTMLN